MPGWVLHVFRMDIEARRRDDHLALASDEAEFSLIVLLGQVAGGEPVRFVAVQCALLPGGAGDHIATDENLAFVGDADIASGKNFANGSLARLEGMVERDERGRLRHAVALNQREAERVPEILELGGQRSAAADERPEFVTEKAMNPAKSPPALPDFFAGRSLNFRRELRIGGEQVGAEQIEHARHRADDGDALAVHRVDQALRLEARFEVDFGGHQRGNPERHELAEDVAERKRVQKADGVERPLVFEVFLHLALDGV
jgi:hypothetical protein